MRNIVLILLGISLLTRATSNAQESVDLNLVIEINEEIVTNEIDISIIPDLTNSIKINSTYLPGRFVLSSEEYSALLSSKTDNFLLTFTHEFVVKGKVVRRNYEILSPNYVLSKTYLILKIYDFSDKKFKKYYDHHTSEEYLAEYAFEGSGMKIRKK